MHRHRAQVQRGHVERTVALAEQFDERVQPVGGCKLLRHHRTNLSGPQVVGGCDKTAEDRAQTRFLHDADQGVADTLHAVQQVTVRLAHIVTGDFPKPGIR